MIISTAFALIYLYASDEFQLWKRSSCPLEVLCSGGFSPWVKVHELKRRWLQVLNSSRANGLDDSKFGKLVDICKEESFVCATFPLFVKVLAFRQFPISLDVYRT